MIQTQTNFLHTVKSTAHGQWLKILPAIDVKLTDAVKHVGRHVPNPVYGGTNGFRLFDDANDTGAGVANPSTFLSNGFEVLQYTLKTNFTTVLHKVAQELNIKDWKTTPVIHNPKVAVESFKMDQQTLTKRRNSLRNVWKASFSLTDNRSLNALRYFMYRGIDVNKLNLNEMSKTVRYVPSLPFWHNQKCLGNFPAIISLISYPDGQPASIHRTYLTQYGEKLSLVVDGESIDAKKMMARCENKSISGGAIQLSKANETLHVAEGLETALAVTCAKQVNVWPCVNAGLLGNLIPPENVKRIIVWGDKDKKIQLPNGKVSQAGFDSAMKLSERMQERNIPVISLFPKAELQQNQKGIDWLDVLTSEGETAFPAISHYYFM